MACRTPTTIPPTPARPPLRAPHCGGLVVESSATFTSTTSQAKTITSSLTNDSLTTTLGGTLEVDLTAGFTPPPGTYTLLLAGTRDGTFGTAPPYQPILPPGMSVLYGPNSVSVVQS